MSIIRGKIMGLSAKSFFAICNDVAQNSKCLSRKIGAVIVRDGAIVGTGYNGPPRGVPHCGVRHQYDNKLQEEYYNKKACFCSDCSWDGKSFPIIISGNTITSAITSTICPRQILGYKSGEGLEWCIAGHAERNALINCAREGISTKGCSMYMSCGISCTPCLVEIINAGIVEIIVTKFSFYDLSGEYLVRNSSLIVKNFDGEVFKKWERKK